MVSLRTYEPEEEDWKKLVARAEAPRWMVECLRLNPGYVYWGPGTECMAVKREGYEEHLVQKAWPPTDLDLNDRNEVVHFYFSVERDEKPCGGCGTTGYNADTRRLDDDFTDIFNTGRRWCNAITQDEVDVLVEAGRLPDFGHPPTAEEVNLWADGKHPTVRTTIGHDAINRMILVETRARRLGIWGHCVWCEGHGSEVVSPAPRLALTLWVLHPRKGAARGWTIERIEEGELKDVKSFLAKAAARNAERFAKVVEAQ